MNSRVIDVLLLFAICAGGVASALAQSTETGFLNRAVRVDGVDYKYQVYVPREFRRSIVWPVIVALHGGGDYGNDGLKQTEGGLASAIREHADRFPVVVIFPQCLADGTPGWQTTGGQATLVALDQTMDEFHGDPSRVYLTGYSAGGNGTWYLASHHPERFAALVIISAFVSEFRGKTSGVVYPAIAPKSASDPYAYVARQVSAIPIWVFHGDADKTVSVEESRNMVKALKATGANVQYTELSGVEHNAWDAAYDRADFIEWMLKQSRK